jgi:hypothetical protein
MFDDALISIPCHPHRAAFFPRLDTRTVVFTSETDGCKRPSHYAEELHRQVPTELITVCVEVDRAASSASAGQSTLREAISASATGAGHGFFRTESARSTSQDFLRSRQFG